LSVNILSKQSSLQISRTNYLVVTAQFLQRGSELADKIWISDQSEILITFRWKTGL